MKMIEAVIPPFTLGQVRTALLDAGVPGLLWIQFLDVLATWVLAFVGTLIILSILKAVMGLRVSEEEEQMGLDLSQHIERGYSFKDIVRILVRY